MSWYRQRAKPILPGFVERRRAALALETRKDEGKQERRRQREILEPSTEGGPTTKRMTVRDEQLH